MLPRPRGTLVSSIPRAMWLTGIVLLLFPAELFASPSIGNVISRGDVSRGHRAQLAAKLRKITGFQSLKFDDSGVLRMGSEVSLGGSRSARKLLASSLNGRNVIVIEDASNSAEVAFCRVIPAKWKTAVPGSPPAFVVQIDFADFDRVLGDERALEAFNVGWGFLHELDHIANDSSDALALGEAGECEAHINQMRRECDLPERADYFYTALPLTADGRFVTRLVRLAFEQPQSEAKKMKRYWLVWDANLVGGLEQNQIAAMR